MAAPDSTGADLSWSAGAGGDVVAGYDVYRDGTEIGSSLSTSFTDTSVTPGATYQYAVSAYDAVGDGSGETEAVTVIVPDVGAQTIFADNFTGSLLSSAWTVISRHGEYAQDETECNVPQMVSVHDDMLDIETAAQTTTCGDFNPDGSVLTAPTAWPYATGDIQWSSFSFTYGTVSYRAKFPPSDTVTWPAVWLLGSNCQSLNPFTATTGIGTCPNVETPGYEEIDLTECDTWNWCQLAIAQPHSFPVCGYATDGQWHTFTTVWSASGVSTSVDGTPTGCSYTTAAGYVMPSAPMFLIIQTQTGGVGGTPNNAYLPTHLDVSDVTVTQP